MGIEPQTNMIAACSEIDILRVKKADTKYENSSKESRKLKRSKKRGREDEENPDDPEYSPGAH